VRQFGPNNVRAKTFKLWIANRSAGPLLDAGPRGAFGDECKLAFSAISLQLAVFPAQGADEDDRRYEIAQHR